MANTIKYGPEIGPPGPEGPQGPPGTGIVLAPAADSSQSPLGECVYARYHEGVDAPWSAEL